MNDYQRTVQFIKDWPTKNKHLKEITLEAYNYNLGKYKKHLEIMNKHPYPNEYTEFNDRVKYVKWFITSRTLKSTW